MNNFFSENKKPTKNPPASEVEQDAVRFFGKSYQTALRHHERFVAWKAWQTELDKFIHRADVSSYPHHIQSFLYDQKPLWFSQVSQQYQSRLGEINASLSSSIIGFHKQDPTLTAQQIVNLISEKADHERNRATDLEKRLKGYSSIQALGSTFIRLLIKHPSFQLGHTLLLESNQVASVAPSWLNPIRINTEANVHFYANLTGLILLTCECWVQYSAGFLSYSLFAQLSTLWLSLDLPNSYREYEVVFIRQREQYRFILQICSTLMTSYLLRSETNLSAFLFILCMQSIIGKGIDLAQANFQAAHPAPGVKMLCQWVSFFTLPWLYTQLQHHVEQYFSPAPKKLLVDEQLCKKHLTACHQAALDILGLDSSASSQDIAAASKSKRRQFHPDKNPGIDTRQAFIEVNAANQILLRR